MTWWEMSNEFGESSPEFKPKPKETLRCPVCKHILDHRNKGDSMFSYCKECKVTFFFEGSKLTPSSAVPDSCLEHSKNKCGCGRCGR